MIYSRTVRFVAALALAFPLGILPVAAQSDHKPLPLHVDPGSSDAIHRLILIDGTFQVVRKYEIVGERVRYMSAERGGEWEELPADLVDWAATRKWERDQFGPVATDASPAMQQAAQIDKEEADERARQKAQRPEVAKGLELPDEDGVFALDRFEGTPELVELAPVDLSLDAKNRHGLSTLNPLARANANLELDGTHSKIHLHVNEPAIYLSLGARDDAEQVISHALTVDTGSARETKGKHGAHSPQLGFALVRVDQRQAMRIVGAIHINRAGAVTQDENVIATKVEVLPGKHWLKITPTNSLASGEYALVEIISSSDISQSVWDFRVDPLSGDNLGSLGPILR